MPEQSTDELTERFHAALREPELTITLGRSLLGGRALLWLTKPGATPRSKPVQLVPVVVGDEGDTHSVMLHMLADAMDSARGGSDA